MSTTAVTETTPETAQVHKTLRLVIQKFTEAAEQHCLSLASKMATVLIDGLIRINQRVYAVDAKWQFVIHAQQGILCVKQSDGIYAEVDIDKLNIVDANTFVARIGVITAALLRQ